VETVVRDIVVYLEGSAHLLHLGSFRIICGCILLQENIAKYTWEENVRYTVNIEIVAFSEIHKYLPSVYFESDGQITQTPTITVRNTVTERYVSLMFSEVGNDHCDTPLPNEEKRR
jgi:hypothetical protein